VHQSTAAHDHEVERHLDYLVVGRLFSAGNPIMKCGKLNVFSAIELRLWHDSNNLKSSRTAAVLACRSPALLWHWQRASTLRLAISSRASAILIICLWLAHSRTEKPLDKESGVASFLENERRTVVTVTAYWTLNLYGDVIVHIILCELNLCWLWTSKLKLKLKLNWNKNYSKTETKTRIIYKTEIK